MSWFEEWFDENYLELYANRDPKDAQIQANLIVNKIGKTTGRWLDVGCGMGRYTAIFKDRGYPITGIDISKTLIEAGRKRYPELDIRHSQIESLISMGDRYQVILSLFTSFGYYDEDRENLAFLKAMGDVAVSRGYLWFDFLNAKKILQDPLTDTVFRAQSGKIFQQKRRIYVSKNHSRIEKKIEVFDKDGVFFKTYRESVRLFTVEDFFTLLPQAGFTVKELYGDYQGGSYTPTSPRLIIWAEKS